MVETADHGTGSPLLVGTGAPLGGSPRERSAVTSASVTFLSFAAPASMLGVIWPEVRARFHQSLGALGIVTLCYGIGRLSTAVSGRPMVRRVGRGRAFVAVLGVLVAACVAMALSPSWPWFLVATAALGATSGALDSLGAGFIAGVGKVSSAGLIHGAYGVGATFGPLAVLVMPSWRAALGTAAALAVVALAVAIRARPAWPAPVAEPAIRANRPPVVPVVLSLAAFAAFVAVEVTAGQWFYTYLTDQRRARSTIAAVGVACFWGGLTLGRLGLARARFRAFATQVGLTGLAITAGVLMLGVIVAPPVAAPFVLAIAGVALAPVIPSLFATTSGRVGSAHAQRLAGWQLVATNVGAITVPSLTGALVDGRGPGAVAIVVIVSLGVGVALLAAISRQPESRP